MSCLCALRNFTYSFYFLLICVLEITVTHLAKKHRLKILQKKKNCPVSVTSFCSSSVVMPHIQVKNWSIAPHLPKASTAQLYQSLGLEHQKLQI